MRLHVAGTRLSGSRLRRHSALQEEIDGHDVVVRFSDWWNGNGAYGNKTTFRVYSRIGKGLQNFEGDMFAKRDMVKSSVNASDGYVVLWNEGMNSCKDRLEMLAWFKKMAAQAEVPIYTFAPEDLKGLVLGWYEYILQDPVLKDCMWNGRFLRISSTVLNFVDCFQF